MSTKKNSELIKAVKFTLFSISAGLIQGVTFVLLFDILHLSYWPSYLVSLVLSVLWNFTLNRKFTFQSAANVPIAMMKVAVFYAVFTPVSTGLGNYAVETLGWNGNLMTALNMVANFVLEYLYDRFFVFNDKKD